MQFLGNWLSDPYIKLVKVNGRTYALNGWNGIYYESCFEVDNANHHSIIKNNLAIYPTNKGEYILLKDMVGSSTS